MKILVPIKRVADPANANKVKVDDDATKVTSEGLEWVMNPFDEWSLEAALRLTENAAEKARVGEIVCGRATATMKNACHMAPTKVERHFHCLFDAHRGGWTLNLPVFDRT